MHAPIYGSAYMPVERLWNYAKRSFRKRCFNETKFESYESVKSLIKDCIKQVPAYQMEKNVNSCFKKMQDAID